MQFESAGHDTNGEYSHTAVCIVFLYLKLDITSSFRANRILI